MLYLPQIYKFSFLKSKSPTKFTKGNITTTPKQPKFSFRNISKLEKFAQISDTKDHVFIGPSRSRTWIHLTAKKAVPALKFISCAGWRASFPCIGRSQRVYFLRSPILPHRWYERAISRLQMLLVFITRTVNMCVMSIAVSCRYIILKIQACQKWTKYSAKAPSPAAATPGTG